MDELEQLLRDAREAIARGADTSAVEARFRQATGFTSLAAAEQAMQGQGEDEPFLRGLLRAGAQGLTFGFADEIAGLGAALVPGGQTGGSFVGDFREARDESRTREAAFREQHPKAALASEVAGGLVSSIVPVGAAANTARGLGIGARVARGTAAGAAAGATEAVGRSEREGLASLRDAPRGAAIGGTVGAAVPLATGTLTSAGRRVRDLVDPEGAATRVADRQLAESVGNIDEATEAARELARTRPNEAILADINPQTRALLDVSTAASPRVAEQAGDVLSRRQAGQAGRIIDDIETLVGEPVNIPNLTAQHAEELSALGKRLFAPIENAFPRIAPDGVARSGSGKFITRAQTDQLRAFLDRPIVRRAARQVNELEEMVSPGAGAPSFRQLQDVRRRLGSAADRAVAANDRRAARDFGNARTQLTNLMESIVPGYREANRQYRRLATVGEALRSGPDILKARGRDARALLDKLRRAGGEDAVSAARLSVADALIEDLRGLAINRNAAARFVNASQDFQQTLRIVFPKERQLQDLVKRLETEHVFSRTASAGGNSATARRLAAFDEIAGQADPVGAGVAGGVVGGPAGAVTGVLSHFANQLRGGSRALVPRAADRLGPELTVQGEKNIFRALERLRAIQERLAKQARRATTLRETAAVLGARQAAAR